MLIVGALGVSATGESAGGLDIVIGTLKGFGVVGLFVLITGIAMLTGNWESSVGEAEYSRRIRDIDNPIYQHNQGSAPAESSSTQWQDVRSAPAR